MENEEKKKKIKMTVMPDSWAVFKPFNIINDCIQTAKVYKYTRISLYVFIAISIIGMISTGVTIISSLVEACYVISSVGMKEFSLHLLNAGNAIRLLLITVSFIIMSYFTWICLSPLYTLSRKSVRQIKVKEMTNDLNDIESTIVAKLVMMYRDTGMRIRTGDLYGISRYIVDSILGSFVWCSLNSEVHQTELKKIDWYRIRFSLFLLVYMASCEDEVTLNEVFIRYLDDEYSDELASVKTDNTLLKILIDKILNDNTSLCINNSDDGGGIFKYLLNVSKLCREIGCDTEVRTHDNEDALPAPRTTIMNIPNIKFEEV